MRATGEPVQLGISVAGESVQLENQHSWLLKR